MRKNSLLLSTLVVALTLGTAWAIRGKFGHEQGAAWAGAIGALSIILVAKREDWYRKAFKVALAAAFGWGIGGVISYGVVVGYGRGLDFINVYYGLLMLFLIGLLYGFLGGGMLALALIDSPFKKIKWHRLLTEMVAIALITYGFLINQLEWYMTPPRSELWAACLGAAIALAWYVVRIQEYSVLKVAVWSALGSGFGFAFGNFLQILGSVSEIEFNFWNVMEYSIGFFGGMGMAYGTFTADWPIGAEKPHTSPGILPILILVIFIPFVVWQQSFVTDRFDFLLEAGQPVTTIFYFKLAGILSIGLMATLALYGYFRSIKNKTLANDSRVVKNLFILYTGVFLFLSFLVTGFYRHPPEQYLYILNVIAVLLLMPRLHDPFETKNPGAKTWSALTGILIMALVLLAAIAISIHGNLPGSHQRFP